MMLLLRAVGVGAGVWFAGAAAAFTPAATSRAHVARRTAKRSISLPLSPTPPSNDDVFLWSFEGTLVSSHRSRSWMAVCVALRVWPCLESNMRELGMDPDFFSWERIEGSQDMEEPHQWLLQKLSALASITQQGESTQDSQSKHANA